LRRGNLQSLASTLREALGGLKIKEEGMPMV